MVMQYETPKPGGLDKYTRMDDLMLANMQAMQRVASALDQLTAKMVSGQGNGSVSPVNMPISQDIGTPQVYKIDITNGCTNRELTFSPCNYIQFKGDGSMAGISVKMENQSSQSIPLDDYTMLPANGMRRIFITADAVTGRTELRIYCTRILPLGDYMAALSGGHYKVINLPFSEASIAAATKTTLADCTHENIRTKKPSMTVTVRGKYNALATAGIKIYVITSTDNWDWGTHTGGAHATVMTDSTAHFVTNELIGLTIVNSTDGSSGVITANTETTVTVAALTGGTANAWALGDVWTITGCDYDTEPWDIWTPAFTAGAVFRETKNYDTDPVYVKFLVENLDAAQTVTDVEILTVLGAAE